MTGPEAAWCAGAFAPPASPPEYDWDLDRWIRARRERDGHDRAFYNSPAWRRLRARVIAESHGASMMELSSSPARFVPATVVHHVMRVGEHPGWALSEWAVEGGLVVRNLVPLSHDAHDVAHGRFRHRPRAAAAGPLTEERW